MRYLKVGVQGPDVLEWETFLRGVLPNSKLVVDGVFDEQTKLETQRFQSLAGFVGSDIDGVVGNETLGRAAANFGYGLAKDDNAADEFGPNWPAIPAGVKQLAYADRESVFGRFAFVAAGSSDNPEAIKITDGWAKNNIVSIVIPQLKNVSGASASGTIQVHAKVAKQLQAMFAAWEAAGLKGHILSWGGSWVPRFIRGSRTVLSNHSWGTAFDINVPWNMLGTVPALKGRKGSVRELIAIAIQHGFYWGGWFSRADGMHFECFKVLP